MAARPRRTLALTSPQMMDGQDKSHKKDVSDAQYLFNNNVFKTRFYEGQLDGVYGLMSGQAAYRAKYWLGYPLYAIDAHKRVNQQFGDVLFNLLHGDSHLTPYMRWLRNQRLKKQNEKPMREKAFELGLKYIGTKESPPDSNRVMFSTWYGLIGSWCAMYESYCYVNVGSKSMRKGQYYAYVPYLEYDAYMGRNGLTFTRTPQRGDLVCFDWDRDGVSDHTGMFDEWIIKGQSFRTLEGNTGIGNDSNGGEVMRRDRFMTNVSFHYNGQPAFIHVGR